MIKYPSIENNNKKKKKEIQHSKQFKPIQIISD